jgi:hypothetical protein
MLVAGSLTVASVEKLVGHGRAADRSNAIIRLRAVVWRLVPRAGEAGGAAPNPGAGRDVERDPEPVRTVADLDPPQTHHGMGGSVANPGH